MNLKDKTIIRDLAKKQLYIANSEKMKEIIKCWRASNNFKPIRPMVTVEIWPFAKEVIFQTLKCQDEDAREIETMLQGNIVNHLLFDDDTVVKDFIPIQYNTSFKPFDIDIKIGLSREKGLGHHFVEIITDLKEDFHKLKKSTFTINKNNEQSEKLNDIIGDILPTKLVGSSIVSCPTQNLVHIMSMENMLFSMYDYPELFKKMMDNLANDYLEFFDALEKENVVMPTVSSEFVGQGSYAFTDELPKDGNRLNQVWGFMDSQETVGISPEMFAEFIFPAYEKIDSKFGLLSYGCCEPVHSIWDGCLSKLDNIRKLSISPWCDEDVISEKLKGKNIVYHRKPSPNFIGVGNVMDENAVSDYMSKTVKLNKRRSLEFTQRDVYTINNDIDKVNKYVKLIRNACERYW